MGLDGQVDHLGVELLGGGTPAHPAAVPAAGMFCDDRLLSWRAARIAGAHLTGEFLDVGSVELVAARQAELEGMDLERLSALRDHVIEHRAWPRKARHA